MTAEQKAAYVNAQAASMLAELESMKAANQLREYRGEAQAWTEEDFYGLPDKYGLGCNTVMLFFRD